MSTPTLQIAASDATPDDAVEIGGRKAWKIAAVSRDPAGAGPRLLFQHVRRGMCPEVRTA